MDETGHHPQPADWSSYSRSVIESRFVFQPSAWTDRPGNAATGEGLWLIPCKQIHMFWMKYPLSIWFLDESGRVISILDDLKPWQVSPYYKQASSALEFPSGWGVKTGTQPGDLLIFE